MVISGDPSKVNLVYYPDPVLKKVCAPVTEFGPKLQGLVERMFALMNEHKGVGLAGPQVGLTLRLFVSNHTGEPQDNRLYVNPVLSGYEGVEEMAEGCLSFPEVNVVMRRAKRATIQACDAEGRPFESTAEGLLARIWQHETDHLDGKLIVDRMSEADEIANRRALKYLKDQYKRGRSNSRVPARQ
jgi:peptide deformylase